MPKKHSHVQLPLNFCKALSEKEPIFMQLWLSWIYFYKEKIKEPFIYAVILKDHQNPGIDEQTIKKVFDLGEPFLEGFAFLSSKNEKQQLKEDSFKEVARTILAHLNHVAGTTYGARNDSQVIKPIISVLKAGYKPDECITVIDKKAAEWMQTDFQKHLNTNTLFGNKFDLYLNQPTKNAGKSTGNGSSQSERIGTSVAKAVEFHLTAGQK